MEQSLFKEYFLSRRTLSDLVKAYGHSRQWIQERIHAYKPEFVPPSPRNVVLVIDATYFGKRGKGFGILIAKDIRSGAVVAYRFIRYETIEAYRQLKESIEVKGFHIQAVTLDGRRGTRELFDSIPVQMCHFHQQAILTRYLTRKPKHPAAKTQGDRSYPWSGIPVSFSMVTFCLVSEI